MKFLMAALLLIGFAKASLHAQAATARSAEPGTIVGAVVDTAGRPVPDADVLVLQLRQRTRSRSDGSFRFDSVTPGKYTIEVRHIGYSMQSAKITVKEAGAAVTIKLVRVPFFLPSVVTTANRGGLSGVIADTGYKALAGVRVNVLGGNQMTETDTAGAFFLPVKPGHYLVELKRSGFARQLVGVTVPVDTGRKLAAWMVPQNGGSEAREGALLFDLPHRVNMSNPVWDHYFTREDMEKAGIEDLRELGSSVSMRLMNPDCPVYVNGDLTRWVPLWSLKRDEVEFVEVYVQKDASPTGGPTGGARGKLATLKQSTNGRPQSECKTALIAWLRK